MIQLTCANCRNQLEVDDAFAGSVCRCQHCGTIQTVPKKGAAAGRPRAPGSSEEVDTVPGDQPKALYQVKSRAGMSSHPSGLEELAEVVHSSGLGSGLLNRSSPNLNLARQKQKKQAKKTMIIAIAAAVGLIIVTVLIMLLFNGGSKSANNSFGNSADNTASPGNVISKPVFASIDLSGEKIIYVVDRGDATADFFGGIKIALLKSAKSLGPGRKFAVLLWNNGEDDSFPHTGTVYASSDEIGKLGNWLDNVSTGRATSINSALNNAMFQTPKEIVIITAKGDQLEEEFTTKVEKIRGSRSVAIHCISINSDCDAMKKIAKDSAGKYVRLSGADLNAIGDN